MNLRSTLFLFLVAAIIFSCSSTKNLQKDGLVLSFVKSNKFKYSISGADIPTVVFDTLERINGKRFMLGDSSVISQVNLSDVQLSNAPYFNSLLHFTLINDSICLLTYTRGGRGTYTVVDYIQYKGKSVYVRFVTIEKINGIEKLKTFLSSTPPKTYH